MSHKNFSITKYSYVNPKVSRGRTPVEWNVLGFNTSNKEDIAKAKAILQLSDSVTAADHLTTALHSLRFVADRLSKQSSQAQLLSEDIENFREKLHSNYLDLLADPIFIAELLNLGDGCSISDNSLDKSTAV